MKIVGYFGLPLTRLPLYLSPDKGRKQHGLQCRMGLAVDIINPKKEGGLSGDERVLE
jgi:hypothetical protein